jgi:protein kinase C substrate 80K-H
LGHTTQKSKKGGGNTGMGTFAHITSISADEDLPADGKGLGSGERIALKYENGQHCWNGPARSTLVVLACAEVDEIWKVVEEEKCVYRMEVGTPAVCGVEVKKADVEGGHDEL